MTAAKLPPHGKQFADARARGLTPRRLGFGHMVVVLDWNQPTAAHAFIIVLDGVDPAGLNLSFCAGLHVTISHTDDKAHRVQHVIDALFAAGAGRVDACNLDALDRGDDLDAAWPRFYREELRHAA